MTTRVHPNLRATIVVDIPDYFTESDEMAIEKMKADLSTRFRLGWPVISCDIVVTGYAAPPEEV